MIPEQKIITITVVGIFLIIVAFTIGGGRIGPLPENPNVAAKDDGTQGNLISRWIDREAGVVCWIYDGYQGDGIACLPLKDTRLGASEK